MNEKSKNGCIYKKSISLVNDVLQVALLLQVLFLGSVHFPCVNLPYVIKLW